MSTDEEVMVNISNELLDAVSTSLPIWIERSVNERLRNAHIAPTEEIPSQIAKASEQAQKEIVEQLRQLFSLDIDDQKIGPLQILRRATVYPTEILRSAGVPPVPRDEQAISMFADDIYDLTPANFADLGPDVHEKAIVWGAAKAHIHLSRRRAEGQR